MPTTELLGRVVVVAGSDAVLVEVVELLAAAGAFVAFVSRDRQAGAAHVAFRADPGDSSVWERVAPHVEQRLGPVDAVLTEPANDAVVRPVFEPDLARRGHGRVVVLPTGAVAGDVVSALADTR